MTTNTEALLRGASRENDAHDEAKADRYCDMGVGCGEYGACYAAANGEPEQCPRTPHPAPTQPEQAKGGEPLFWYRPCSNGLYEGPLHNKSIEDVRKRSGAWVPLYPHHPAPAASAEREARVIEQNARKAAQEQLYAERERHTAEVKRLQAEIGRLKAPAASVSDEQRSSIRLSCEMLGSYIAAIKESGEYDRWHYIPQVEVVQEDLRAVIDLRPAQAGDQWREAVEEQFAVNHTDMPEDPREAIKKLIATEVRDALDPSISSAAAALVQAGVPDDIVKDALRYRWLRAKENQDNDAWNTFGPYSSPQAIDAAIDAAMLAAAPKEGGAA